MEVYAEIVLPLPRGLFTYRAEGDVAAALSPGTAVEVRFRNKVLMGVVWRLSPEEPGFATRPVERVVTSVPVLSPRQMRMWEWVADYYMCSLGEVMKFALPSALKPKGDTREEFLADEYRPATVKYLSLGSAVRDEESLAAACESLRRAKVQYAAFMEFCSLAGGEVFSAEVPLKSVKASSVIIHKLVDRGFLRVEKKELARECRKDEEVILPVLTAAQTKACRQINERFASHACVLLHGVTGSGKTEIYTHLIAEQLRAGRSVLYLVPEIAMSSQLVDRLRSVFGERVTAYHSRATDRARAEIYRRLAAGSGGELILGARSSVFLPMPGLGLVIVDEEHDPSYKQSESAPFYNARDCAVYTSRSAGVPCLLASATPSIESYVNATGGKYGLVTLTERYGEGRLPEVTISDTLRAVKRGERKVHFNKLLYDKMGETLADGRQVMLFQNRRGFSPYLECGQCGHVWHCRRCSVTMSYHKRDGRLKCHMCGLSVPVPRQCPVCGAPDPQLRGFGTEKVEEEIARLFPESRVLRLDADTATSEKRSREIVRRFAGGEADILVGTQMITKGFDFPKLSLVGILNADNLLSYPDFRAGERAYQIMTQVAGRAGRSDDKGEVVIQTSQPENPLIGQVRRLDYDGMVRDQLAERRLFGYPPFGKLIEVSLRHRREELLGEAAGRLAADMRRAFGESVYGPHVPVVGKAGNEYYMSILLKIGQGDSPSAAKKTLAGILDGFGKIKEYKYVFVSCDVDPY